MKTPESTRIEPLDHITKLLIITALQDYAQRVQGTLAEGLGVKSLQIANEVQAGKIGRVPA